jgi:predicted nucleic acid-binding protein
MREIQPRIYADTSVFGGAFDPEFEGASRRFFELVDLGRFRLVVSSAVEDELEGSPPRVEHFYRDMLPAIELVETPAEAFRLQEAYTEHAVVSPRRAADALHVAAATVSACSVIASWNLKHIVNYRRIPLYNAVNALHGYGSIAIITPLEVVGSEEDEV